MSYGSAAALQAAVYARLTGDAGVSAAVGDAIYDAVPAGARPELYVSLGTEEATARGDSGGAVARYRLVVSVFGDEASFHRAKEAAGAVAGALEDAPLALASGHLMSLRFQRAQARRVGRERRRRIDLRFEALVDG